MTDTKSLLGLYCNLVMLRSGRKNFIAKLIDSSKFLKHVDKDSPNRLMKSNSVISMHVYLNIVVLILMCWKTFFSNCLGESVSQSH